jgi:hypothetical protein
VSVERKADTGPGLVEVSLAPEDSWRGSVFISLYRGPFHERKEIRPDAEGRYRLEARLPPGDETGIYLRYGPGQSGYAGSSWITLPASGGTSVSDVSLANGFSGSFPRTSSRSDSWRLLSSPSSPWPVWGPCCR